MKLTVKRFNEFCIFIVFAFLTLFSSTAFSAVPGIINYQGSLSDAGGNPVNATLNITFVLYDAEVAGASLWQETQSVTVTNGQFSVQLGADIPGNPLPAFLDDPVFLGVQVDTDAEMTPRQKFTSTAFALRAKTVETDTLNSLSCAANEIPKFSGGVWVCAVDDSGTGDITGVTAGNGLTGGGVSGDVNIAVDTNVIQNRVDGSCNVESSIRAIAADGTVTCELDNDSGGDITAVNAGSGLTGGAVSGDATLSVATSGINDTHLAADAVGLSELSDLARGVGVNGSIVIPASEFQAQDFLTPISFSSLGSVHPLNLNTNLCIQAPVNLPTGVTITLFEISALDNSTQNIGLFTLTRVSFTTGATTLVASVGSNGALPLVRVFTDTTITSPLVNGLTHSYFIRGCIQSDSFSTANTQLFGARIRYN